ncbi:MAG: hypothetical protein AB7P17_15800 [Nitrospirales bacterium]|nr:hypothetical protein [Nitrospirales bacterium]
MIKRRIAIFHERTIYWIQQIGFVVFTALWFSACAQISPPPGTGEKAIPPGIENQIYPDVTTQDEVLAMLGEPVARLKTQTDEGHFHIWTYSYMDLQSKDGDQGESLTIVFDNKSFLVKSVTRGPL